MRWLHIFYFLFTVATLCIACQNISQESSVPPKKTAAANGTEISLAKQYCGSCHQWVKADLLDQQTWLKNVLPKMAPHLGIGVYMGEYIYDPGESNKTISFKKWMEIVDYYEKHAPKKLVPATPPVPLKRSWSIFELKKPNTASFDVANTVMTVTDTANGMIYTCDGSNNNLYRWDKNLKPALFCKLPSPAVNAQFATGADGRRQGIFTCIGSITVNDLAEGEVLTYNLNDKPTQLPDTIAASLARPVQSIPFDINKDGLTDWLVCSFGHNTGGLFCYVQLQDGRLEKKVISATPGVCQAITGDYNNDGWPDIIALFAHAEEGIRLFLNDRKGGFVMTRLIDFLPVNGSTSFQLADFNRDGLMDILYTCGDNGDMSRILKPFHGIYIFINQGNFQYKQAYFYPVNGCTKAIAADFDMDGDLDIASIAFFADLKDNPSEKFIYFEQDSSLTFIAHAPPIEKYGRWISMDVSDYDKDGDPDIILGNLASGFINQTGFVPDWDMHLPMIILQNRRNKNLLK